MLGFERLAERRIEEAVANGEFDNLPGAGKPLDLDEDRLVPPEQAMAYRILKNAGYVPEDIMLRREIASARAALNTSDAAERLSAAKRLSVLEARLSARSPARSGAASGYRVKLLEKLGRL